LFSLVYFPGCHYHGNVVINASCNALIGQFLVERVQLPMEGGEGYSPAPGVMHTRPVIIPCTAPITDGFPKKKTSSSVHMSRLVDAQICVLSTAMDESMLAEYGSPPLKPVHPSHSSPAPASTSNMLFGGKRSLSDADLGPTCVQGVVRTIEAEMQ